MPQKIQIRITVTKEIDELLDKLAKKLGKKKSSLAREIMEQKMLELNIFKGELK